MDKPMQAICYRCGKLSVPINTYSFNVFRVVSTYTNGVYEYQHVVLCENCHEELRKFLAGNPVLVNEH